MKQQSDKKYYFIINPTAGNQLREKAIECITSFLKNNQIEYKISFTEYAGDAKKIAQKAIIEKFHIVVAVGGDGTINEVVQGIIGSDATLGIIPTGSGNGLARELGISMNPKKALKKLLYGQIKLIDIGLINKRLFLCTCGIGFDAHIAYKMSLLSKRGQWQYVWLIIKESFNFKPITIEIEIDGKLIKKKLLGVTFANTRQYGNNIYIAPSAKIDDGILDIMIVPPINRILYPLVAFAFFTRNVERFGFIKHLKATEVIIHQSDTIYHFDGESDKIKIPAKVTVSRAGLKIIV